MKEHALRFGSGRSLVGVVTEPGSGVSVPNAPAVLFLNSGLLHHVGPHRLHVNLARRLGRAGLRSLRFDLSGIGDSAPRQDRMPREESMLRETQEAMDAMTAAHGATTFVLFGICTGADQAVRVALQDSRVTGAILVDGYSYATSGHRLRYYANRALRPRSWWHMLSLQHPVFSRIASGVRGAPAPPAQSAPPAPDRPHAPDGHETPPAGPRPGMYVRPPRDEAEARVKALVERGCRLCFVFTPSPRFSHATQFREMYPSVGRHPRIRVEFLRHADHVFTLLASQETVTATVEKWLHEAVLSDEVAYR